MGACWPAKGTVRYGFILVSLRSHLSDFSSQLARAALTGVRTSPTARIIIPPIIPPFMDLPWLSIPALISLPRRLWPLTIPCRARSLTGPTSSDETTSACIFIKIILDFIIFLYGASSTRRHCCFSCYSCICVFYRVNHRIDFCTVETWYKCANIKKSLVSNQCCILDL